MQKFQPDPRHFKAGWFQKTPLYLWKSWCHFLWMNIKPPLDAFLQNREPAFRNSTRIVMVSSGWKTLLVCLILISWWIRICQIHYNYSMSSIIDDSYSFKYRIDKLDDVIYWTLHSFRVLGLWTDFHNSIKVYCHFSVSADIRDVKSRVVFASKPTVFCWIFFNNEFFKVLSWIYF